MASIYPEFERFKGNPMAIVALDDRVPRDGKYLETLENWDGDKIAAHAYDSIEEIVDARASNSKSRLAIRLAILQAFIDLNRTELTMAELRGYWKVQVPRKWLTHPAARKIHKPHMMNPADVVAMAGFGAPKVAPHPSPPIKIVSFDGLVREDEAPSTNSHHDYDEIEDLKGIKPPEIEPDSSEGVTLATYRKTQTKFRKNVVDYWKIDSLTGVENIELLVASHIKPWRYCDDGERVDAHNGLLLSPNMDKLFDLGHITFEQNGKIRISNELSEGDRVRFQVHAGLQLPLAKLSACEHYMGFHRSRVFRE